MAKTKAKDPDETNVQAVEQQSGPQSAEDLSELLEALKAEKAALLAELEEAKASKVETKDKNKRVPCYVPYIPGEDPEMVVIVNGEVTKFKKGVWVDVKPSVKAVIDNMMEAENEARANQERLKYQRQDL